MFDIFSINNLSKRNFELIKPSAHKNPNINTSLSVSLKEANNSILFFFVVTSKRVSKKITIKWFIIDHYNANK